MKKKKQSSFQKKPQNFIGLVSTMLHTKPQVHWHFGFGEDF